MELRLLGENKLKIILTDEDMDLYDLSYDEMCYNENTVPRRVLFELLDEAKHRCGFEVRPSDDLYVQVHSEKGGGCFLVVTNKGAPPNIRKGDPYTYEKKYRTKVLVAGVRKKRVLYMFENSETLLEACNRLNLTGYNGKSDIFADGKKYYLHIEDNREAALELIGEYGVLINNPMFSLYLDEHTKKIMSPDAVKMFSEVFK